MRILFLGDISIPYPYQVRGDIDAVFQEADLVFANLEGPILSAHDLVKLSKKKKIVLGNTPDVLDVLKAFYVQAVCLANNHMYDGDLPASYTRNILQAAGIESFGAGTSLREASRPYVATIGITTVKIFAFGWHVIGCQPATSTHEGINPLIPNHMLATICNLRERDSTSCVIFLVHWNYELEQYPQPAHRQLAHDLIRAGVDGIIGMHSHVAAGAETIEYKPVIYGLGNWLFPPRQVGHILLHYPPIASRQLAVEIAIEGRQIQDIRFHWYQWEVETGMLYQEKIEGLDGTILKTLTPYTGMDHHSYVSWFRRNRIRRRGLPVYDDYTSTLRTYLKDRYVLLRQSLIDLLVRLRLKQGPDITTLSSTNQVDRIKRNSRLKHGK